MLLGMHKKRRGLSAEASSRTHRCAAPLKWLVARQTWPLAGTAGHVADPEARGHTARSKELVHSQYRGAHETLAAV